MIMVGTEIEGHGGISRVIKIWQDANIFNKYSVEYIAASTEADVNKVFYFIKVVYKYLLILIHHRIVYIHTSSNISFFRKSLFAIIGNIFGKKIILHIHPSHFYDFLVGLKGIKKWYSNHILKSVSGLVVLTDEMRNKLEVLFPYQTIRVLRNGIDFAKMVNMNGYQRSDNQLLYLGSYIQAKGVYELVDAVEILLSKGRSVRLDLYGMRGVDELRKYVSSKDLSRSVKVHGWIGHDDKLRKLYESTMLILPSHTEGMPNVILEAMATKTPIVSTHVGGLREVLRDGSNSIVINVKDSHDISDKVGELLDQRKVRFKITETAYREAKAIFDIQIIKQEFDMILEEI